jgi:hypothetical protein
MILTWPEGIPDEGAPGAKITQTIDFGKHEGVSSSKE